MIIRPEKYNVVSPETDLRSINTQCGESFRRGNPFNALSHGSIYIFSVDVKSDACILTPNHNILIPVETSSGQNIEKW